MKKFLIFIFTVVTVSSGYTQNCDIVSGMKGFTTTDLRVGQETELRFDVFNDAKGGTGLYQAKSVLAVLSLPSNGLKFEAITSPVDGKGKYFTWTYNEGANAIIGINHSQLANAQGDMDVTIRLSGTLMATYDIARSVVLNIMQNPDGNIFVTNDPSNDNRSATVTIRSPKAVELSSFSAASVSCNKIVLTWQTTDEQFNDYIEVQRSTDGKNFIAVGNFKGSNLNKITPYQFTDEKALDPGATYIYRLNQVSIGGIAEIIQEVTLENVCPFEDVALDIFPNPAFDKTFVTIRGLSQKENVTLEIISVTGAQVMILKPSAHNAPIEVKLDNLPSGVYNVRIAGKDEVESKRFIKIN